ncbi:MAG: 16S rRNA (guanine(966)-N(2))-methyltransferase RsmD [Gammaproteobacteria bacterium]
MSVKRQASGRVRIIAGQWKRRHLVFPARPALRPTPDRVRETLFNWLGPQVQGARCLDLFAGSGALGFEAASRGASHVVMVERDEALIHYLSAQALALDANNVAVMGEDVLRWLQRKRPVALAPFDLVFIDPPFRSELWTLLCGYLEQGSWLQDGALVYLERPWSRAQPVLPANWGLTRSGRAGQVGYYLCRRCPGPRVSD